MIFGTLGTLRAKEIQLVMYLSCGYKVQLIMNGKTKNIISVALVEPLLMTGGTVDYSKRCHVEYYFIRLGIEQIVTSIVTMVPNNKTAVSSQ